MSPFSSGRVSALLRRDSLYPGPICTECRHKGTFGPPDSCGEPSLRPILTVGSTTPWPGGANIAKTTPASIYWQLMSNAVYDSDSGLSRAIKMNGGYRTELIFENQKSHLIGVHLVGMHLRHGHASHIWLRGATLMSKCTLTHEMLSDFAKKCPLGQERRELLDHLSTWVTSRYI
jgi:hypothetical protein